jgi:hypothetical protein
MNRKMRWESEVLSAHYRIISQMVKPKMLIARPFQKLHIPTESGHPLPSKAATLQSSFYQADSEAG